MKDNLFLSVIIPCYNEEANLKAGVLQEVWSYLHRQKYPWEIIIIDDGSRDKSLLLSRNFARRHSGIKVIANEHRGKPWAVWAGIKAAQGNIILFTDMDQSTPLREVEKLLPWFPHFDIVIGSRGLSRQNASWLRKLMAFIFLNGRRFLLLTEIVDTQCGFKAMKTTVACNLFPRLDIFSHEQGVAKGWRVSAFDVELLFLAQKKGYKIKEVKVYWRDRDLSRLKKKNFLKESLAMAKEVLRIKINNFLGRYD